MVKKFNLLKMIRRELGLSVKKGGFLMMASKVGGRETFQIKTLVGVIGVTRFLGIKMLIRIG